jgi:arylsulfatase A-like enzyme
VVLVTIDTLRADHVGCYGYERDTTPYLDRLAEESVLFERAFAPMPTTDASHAAMLTGLHPRSTGVMANGLTVTRPGIKTLGTWFRERGYRTGAITSRTFLDPDTVGLPGFDTFSAPLRRWEKTAVEANRRALVWLDRHGDAPFFLWVHYWDPHGPYDPPREPERSMFGPYRPFKKHLPPYTKEEIRDALNMYDGEVRYADDHAGRLIDEIRRRVGREDVLVVVVSDHGESFDELLETYEWGFAHSSFLTRPTLHVPMLWSWPGRLPEGVRVPTPVGLTALAPTLTALLGDELPGEERSFHGLLERTDGHPPRGDPVFSERRFFFSPRRGRQALSVPELSVVEEDRLLVENRIRGTFLTDLVTDPRGERNLVEEQAELVRRLSGLIRVFRATHPPAPIATESLSGAKAEAMRGLGYVR